MHSRYLIKLLMVDRSKIWKSNYNIFEITILCFFMPINDKCNVFQGANIEYYEIFLKLKGLYLYMISKQ